MDCAGGSCGDFTGEGVSLLAVVKAMLGSPIISGRPGLVDLTESSDLLPDY